MNWLRSWLFGFLFPDCDPLAVYALVREGPKALAELGARTLKAEIAIGESHAALIDTISELNALRNAKSEAPPSPPAHSVRQMRNWSGFKAAAEGRPLPDSPQPISLSRSN